MLLLAVILLGVALRAGAQINNTKARIALTDYFKNYSTESFTNNQKYSVVKVLTSDSKRTVQVIANDVFGMQPFTPELVEKIYEDIRERLPQSLRDYTLSVRVGDYDIRELVTAAWTGNMAQNRRWGKQEYQGNPWVQNNSLPIQPTNGLQGRHLSLAASHGRYYVPGDQLWKWQRPYLFCTTEDLLTQSIAVPFLYPMLERAGAIVFTPRERDWQRFEVVVDNDFPDVNGTYHEITGKEVWETSSDGFSHPRPILTDSDNPHHAGTARFAVAQSSKRQFSSARWTPVFPSDGQYAVYVSYPKRPDAVSDATYEILHGGVLTEIQVNQQMGGGTWVYLGTYDFAAGDPENNSITLSNCCKSKGVVLADAVRLGGGMSNVGRSDVHSDSLIFSNFPRHLEAARYSAQWYGMPRSVFGVKEGLSDYGDDINVRGLTTNYLAGGSVYLPSDSGLSVPLELSLALHSDAGFRQEFEYIGSLGIYTTISSDSLLPAGQKRIASRELCDILLQQVQNDLKQKYGTWTRRQMYDRNYGETRVPQVPSAILEMFSHQNYADMLRALDPVFKFRLARSIYRGILRFVTLQYAPSGEEGKMTEENSTSPTFTLAPLPVNSFAAEADAINHRIRLSWQPTPDPLDSTALPTEYILYVRAGEGGWDNGRLVTETTYSYVPADSLLYQFRVEAVNAGGRSMPSETLCARLSSSSSVPSLLIMNGFQRVAGPQAVCSADSCGFDILRDPGVPYLQTTEFCGRQLSFSWDGIGKETSDGMGFSNAELEGQLIKGNTFDYPVLHALDFLAAGDYNISSCSRQAVEEGRIQLGAYHLLDAIMGAQRQDGYSSLPYKTFTPILQESIRKFTQGGGSLLVSGAYIATDMASVESDRRFTQDVLHFLPDGECCAPADTLLPSLNVLRIEGMGTRMSYQMRPNADRLSTAYVSVLRPDSRAFATLVYAPTRQCAAVAYKGADYASLALGFPVEQLLESELRRDLMHAFLDFLISPKLASPASADN